MDGAVIAIVEVAKVVALGIDRIEVDGGDVNWEREPSTLGRSEGNVLPECVCDVKDEEAEVGRVIMAPVPVIVRVVNISRLEQCGGNMDGLPLAFPASGCSSEEHSRFKDDI